MRLSSNANPDEIMSLAKATMAMNAANQGATKLDPSVSNINNNTYNNTDTTTSSVFNPDVPIGQIETATMIDVINNNDISKINFLIVFQTTFRLVFDKQYQTPLFYSRHLYRLTAIDLLYQ